MPVNVFVLNAGSSSLKFQLYEMPGEKERCGGIAERIGKESSSLHWHSDGESKEVSLGRAIPDHATALQEILNLLKQEKLTDSGSIDLIAHRVVHGGKDFHSPVLITEEVKDKINRLSALAPLHNPINLRCIEVMEKMLPDIKQAAVFDTSFHYQLPARAFRYAIPDQFYRKDEVRAYGFHGISHQYVTLCASEVLQNKRAKLISMHLGNGCSICAVQEGKSVDTSMGFGPVSGLVMATRSGDIDPAVVLHLMRKHNIDAEQMDQILNKQSGLDALCGMTDLRDIHKAVLTGNEEAIFACELYVYRIRKYIGAYAAAMNGLDALIFTGGVGENAAYIRQLVCMDMDWMGIRLSDELNNGEDKAMRVVSEDHSRVQILIIPANEALAMARQVFAMKETT